MGFDIALGAVGNRYLSLSERIGEIAGHRPGVL
jgi:hypothetical protein